MVPFAPRRCLGCVFAPKKPRVDCPPYTYQTEHAKSLIGTCLPRLSANVQRNRRTCTSCSHPHGAQTRHGAAPCIVSTAPAVAPTADAHSRHTGVEPSRMHGGPTGLSTPATGAGHRLDLHPHRAPLQLPQSASPPMSLHGTVPRRPSQRSHARRKDVAQVTLAAAGGKGT